MTSKRGLARAASTSVRGPGSLLQKDGRYVVQIRVDSLDRGTRARLAAAGATVVGTHPEYRTVTALVALEALESVAAAPGVEHVSEVLEPMVGRDDDRSGARDDATTSTPCGSVTSEGDTQLKADQARTTFGVDGTGVRVGVLSDSYDNLGGAATDVSTGDLPGPGNPCGRTTPVSVLSDLASGGADEGRAMLQLVHDLAPGSPLSYHTAFNGDLDFAQGIRDLRDAGADVIVDDVTYFNEPFYQDGPIAAAVTDVVSSGVSYFSSAANNNMIVGGKNVGSWEAPAYRPIPCPAGLPWYEASCMDFDPGAGTDNAFAFTLTPGQRLRLDLQWAEPWNGVATDLDMYLLDSTNTVVAQSEETNATTQMPFEFFNFTNSSGATQNYRLAIGRYAGTATPRLKFVILSNGGSVAATEYPDSTGGDVVGPTIFGHNGGESGISTAAVPFDNGSTVETFSSRGPVRHLFAPVTGDAAAPPLASPLVLARPNLAATDGGLTTFFGGGNRFYGTSAAAPHAGGVAALVLDQNPALTPAQVATALTSTAGPVGPFGPSAVGAGRIDALAAVTSVAPTCNGLTATVVGSGSIVGTSGADVIVGSNGVDTITGAGGADTICGLDGNDTVNGGPGNDALLGGNGNDTFLQGTGPDGADAVWGEGGTDTISYAQRPATVTVTLGDALANDGASTEGDRVLTTEAATGGAGNDALTGSSGANTLNGANGNDTLNGAGGNDTEIGGGGNDLFVQGSAVNGADAVNGGTGTDRVSYASRTGRVTVTLAGTPTGDDGATGEGDTVLNVETAYGGSAADTLVGHGGANVLNGNGGGDTLTGGGGADTVSGGDGNDTLRLRDNVSGNDTGNGGPGTDSATADPGDVLTSVP